MYRADRYLFRGTVVAVSDAQPVVAADTGPAGARAAGAGAAAAWAAGAGITGRPRAAG